MSRTRRRRALARVRWEEHYGLNRNGYLGYLVNDWRYKNQQGFPHESEQMLSRIRQYSQCKHQWGRRRRMLGQRRSDPFRSHGHRCMKCGCWTATTLRHRDGTITQIPLEEAARSKYFQQHWRNLRAQAVQRGLRPIPLEE